MKTFSKLILGLALLESFNLWAQEKLSTETFVPEPHSLSLPRESKNAIFLSESGQDARQAMTNVTAFPWSTLGRLSRYNSNNTVNACTGTLVGRRVVLTAAHCLLEGSELRNTQFNAGYINGSITGSAKLLEAILGTRDIDANRSSDWAVFAIDTPLGDTHGYIGVTNEYTLPLNVKFAGYSNNFQNTEIAGVDLNCFIRNFFTNGTMGHDCSMGPGGSGGPLFFGEGSNARIAAVNTRGVNGGVYRGYTVQNANIATMNQQLINAVIQLKNKFDSQ